METNSTRTWRERAFRRRAFVAAASLATAARWALPGPAAAQGAAPGPPLVPDPAGLVDLPAGFQYRVLLRRGDALSNGTPRPGNADGMGTFRGPNNSTLLCVNHELRYTGSTTHPVPHVTTDYDPNAAGGTSVVLVGPDRSVRESWISSSGTVRNCAGGVTPWDTWITVEENEDLPTGVPGGATKSHGWAFEVDPAAPLGGGAPRQVRLDNLGRFNREAVAIDPSTLVIYQTEDTSDGLFYSFRPAPGTRPSGFGAYAGAAGTLAALSVPGLPDANAAVVGVDYAPVWLPVPDPDGQPVPVRAQSYAGTPTRFFRSEGIWWSATERAAYFDCTGGGASGHLGQVWRYTPASNALRLVYKSTDAAVLDMPDNLLVLPWGDVMLCEDGSGEDHLRIPTRRGDMIDFARNSLDEFAGACFAASPDTLYVNIQGESITLAIWGPWAELAR